MESNPSRFEFLNDCRKKRMNWSELIARITTIAHSGSGCGDPVITDICYDSRFVKNGAIYVAIPGFKVHGDNFIAEAVKNGAAAIVSAHKQEGCGVPWAQVTDPRTIPAKLAKYLFEIDFSQMMMVGITGTNGKTTTGHLWRSLLRELYGAAYCWMIGTIVYEMGDIVVEANRTTPEGVDLLRSMGTSEIAPRAIVMEVSSHALALERVSEFLYDIAIFTNLTQDHLDFHLDMKSYYEAKKILFVRHLKHTGIAVVNIDDVWGRRLAEELKECQCVSFGTASDAICRIVRMDCAFNGTAVEVEYQGGRYAFKSDLIGRFNGYNISGLIAGALGKNIDPAVIQKALSMQVGVLGRMQLVVVDLPITVIVDYAHTPDALENILSTARELTTGALVCVFGCGGDRDRTKRALMAAAVAEFADEAVITSDNPRSESPPAIIEDILGGMPLDFPHTTIIDRREAIRKAMRTAKSGDCIVVAGKGHESYQEICGTKHHFSDVETIQELAIEIKGGRI